MNQDAAIALDVCNHFAENNIPILPVHDSFVIQQQYKSELLDVMKRTYTEHTNGFNCPVHE